MHHLGYIIFYGIMNWFDLYIILLNENKVCRCSTFLFNLEFETCCGAIDFPLSPMPLFAGANV